MVAANRFCVITMWQCSEQSWNFQECNPKSLTLSMYWINTGASCSDVSNSLERAFPSREPFTKEKGQNRIEKQSLVAQLQYKTRVTAGCYQTWSLNSQEAILHTTAMLLEVIKIETENTGSGDGVRSVFSRKQPAIAGGFQSFLEELSCSQLCVGCMEKTELQG